MTECSSEQPQHSTRFDWRRWLVWLPALVWMLMIFLFSAQPADESAAVSGSLLGWLTDQLARLLPDLSLDLDFLHQFIRKTAHFVVYTVLGLLTFFAVRRTRTIRVQWPVKRTEMLWAWLISTLYAVTDELHQITVPGRSGEFRDVVLDSSGALTGIVVLTLIFYWQWRRRLRRSANNRDREDLT